MTAIRDDELLVETLFDAPRALVFRLWENRGHLLRWWGPEGYTTFDLDWHPEPGRAWGGTMISEHYGVSRFGGIFREVERDRRLAFTHRWDDDPAVYPETLITVAFADRDGGTLQTFHQAGFSGSLIRDRHIEGWDSTFAKLALYAQHAAVAEAAGVRIEAS